MNEGTNFLQNYVHDEVASELSSSYRDDTLDFMAEYIHKKCEDLNKQENMRSLENCLRNLSA